MSSNLPRVGVRLPPIYLAKLRIIADKNIRTVNNQIARILIKYIDGYEQKYGEIKVDE